jgi:putative peptidoglycan lipid II flippase
MSLEVLQSDSVDAPATQAETNASVAKATGIIALGTIAGKILGLAREIAMTNVFGASMAVDAFNVAILVPKNLFDLLIGGHVNSAIIPVLSAVAAREGREALWRLVSVLLSLVTVMLAVMVLLLEIFAPQVIRVFGGSGFNAATLELTVMLLRLTAPALIFLSLFAVLSGTLYALKVFTWPAFAVAVFNLCIVLATIFLAPPMQIMTSYNAGYIRWSLERPAQGIMAAAFGWLLGSLVQLVLQLPGLKGAKLRLTLNWRHPAIRQIVALYTPVMFSLVLDTLVIRSFSYNLASQTGTGSIAYMNWATTLIQFPHGLVATAISIAILPMLSAQAIQTTREGLTSFRDTLGLGLRLAITLILPASVGLLTLATPIVALLFQHGAFTAHDTAITVLALRLYLPGLPFAALDLLLVYAFYARQDTLTPALIGLLSLSIYMVVAVVLFADYGLFSLMIADSVKHLIHASVSAYLLWRRLDGFGDQRLLLTIGKTLLAGLVMGAVGFLVTPALTRVIGDSTLLREFILLATTGGVSIIAFAVMAFLLKIEELQWLGGLIRRRLGRV